jgi:phage repressor protein C with HTH and peptisase S24 domain
VRAGSMPTVIAKTATIFNQKVALIASAKRCGFRNNAAMDDVNAEWIRAHLTGRHGEQAELAEFVGITPDKLTKILAGTRRVQASEVPRVIAFFQRQAVVASMPNEPTPTLVPVYSVEASAGPGRIVDLEEHVANLAFSPRYLAEMTAARGRDLAAIRVRGDSMEPTLLDDDMVVIDRTKTSLDYDGLFVLRFGEALHCKRVGRGRSRATVQVISDNRIYPPVEMDRSEIEVVGKVLWYGRKV